MFLLEPDARRGADIAVTFSSGAPALITSTHGSGRVALLTTTVDRDWGDLPLRPGFVPLATRTLTWLAGAHGHELGGVIPIGGRKPLERAATYSVTTPTGSSVSVTPEREGEVAVFEATSAPGHYRAVVSGDERAAVERFVVEFDAREADTTPVAIGRAQIEGEAGSITVYEPRWRELALIVLLLVGIESSVRLYLRH
jgi:hypothetical protein